MNKTTVASNSIKYSLVKTARETVVDESLLQHLLEGVEDTHLFDLNFLGLGSLGSLHYSIFLSHFRSCGVLWM